ncbi:MAG: hypothetical protein K9M81_05245 [Chthoniobacterales bacterium]|nr:hypothetical protein [Chthoniobacterales bacterium]
MPLLSFIFGLLLNLIGLFGFFGTGATHYTALIPCALGLLLIASGLVAQKEHLRRHAMHGAVLISLIGLLGTASAFTKIPLLLDHAAGDKAPAFVAKIATAILCGLFFLLCLRSFIKARVMKKY